MRLFLIILMLNFGAEALAAGKQYEVALDLGVGKTQYQIPGHDWSNGLRLGLEVKINPYFYLQGSYISGQEQKNTLVTNGVKVRAGGISAGGLGRLVLSGKFEFFAAAGMMLWDTDISLPQENFSESGNDFYYGFGAHVGVNDKMAFRAAHYTANIGNLFAGTYDYYGVSLLVNLNQKKR